METESLGKPIRSSRGVPRNRCRTVWGELIERRAGLSGHSLALFMGAGLRRDGELGALYPDLTPVQRGHGPSFQNGFTTARITIPISRTVGTSFQSR